MSPIVEVGIVDAKGNGDNIKTKGRGVQHPQRVMILIPFHLDICDQ